MPVVFITGAYEIRNTVTGKVYVGGAYISFARRFRTHITDLEADRHYNKYLQRAWNKYGRQAFQFNILQRCRPVSVREVEQKWLDKLEGCGKGYNLSPTAGSTLGMKQSEETIQKYREARRKIVITEEWRNKMTAGVRQAYKSPETISKVSAGTKKALSDPNTREKMSRSHKGKKLTEKHKAAISIGSIGKVFSNEHKLNISKAQKGRKLSEEHKQAIKSSMTGRKCSKEHTANTRAAKAKLVGNKEFSDRMKDAAKRGWLTRRANKEVSYD